VQALLGLYTSPLFSNSVRLDQEDYTSPALLIFVDDATFADPNANGDMSCK
jgi:hypothetical protein